MAAMLGSRFIVSGDKCYAIDSGKVVQGVLLNRTKNREYELRILPDYKELVVKQIFIDYQSAQSVIDKSYLDEKNHNIANNANAYSVCEQCQSVTTNGKACECSRWA
ncbi:hypothetical protein bcgnr5378_06920 [Bacillus cereus]|uniref:Uncharacterized protein n=1 Tax=Bacillus cereus TaxID=1396 RepID=A0A164NWV2_BACCE|nr:hypothetical protein [Bacillus cereus]KZD65948.1 hypothetical protein B4088_2705 [Bacillus cereus]